MRFYSHVEEIQGTECLIYRSYYHTCDISSTFPKINYKNDILIGRVEHALI